MKERNILICFLAFFMSVVGMAQTSRDEQAAAKIYAYGVYLFNNNNEFVRLQPLKSAGMKQKGVLRPKVYYLFNGEHSNNINNSDEIYVSTLGSSQNVDNYYLIRLEPKKGQRWYSYIKVLGFGKVKNATAEIPILTSELKKGVYKISPSETLSPGSYALFYNYSNGVPTEIFDFDIISPVSRY